MKRFLRLLLLSFAAVAQADGPVWNLTARQRYPWNGIVDVSFELDPCERVYDVTLAATNAATGEALPVGTAYPLGSPGSSLRFASEEGEIRLVWDAGADVPESVIASVSLTVSATPDKRPDRNKVQLWSGGPYWATCNVGARDPWDYGYHFWWGDTVGYVYDEESRHWVASNGSSSDFLFTEANTQTYDLNLDQLVYYGGWITEDGVLSAGCDAAQTKWGDGWRMPTDAEFAGLTNHCDWIFTSQHGVNGCIVRGRGDYRGASIFLPANGGAEGDVHGRDGAWGYYWSSVPNPDDGGGWFSWGLYFSMGDDVALPIVHRGNRLQGMGVRPVKDFTGTGEGSAATTLRLDTRTGTRHAASVEEIVWDSSWCPAGTRNVTVSADDRSLSVSGSPPAAGTAKWYATMATPGVRTLSLRADGEAVCTAKFKVSASLGPTTRTTPEPVPYAWLDGFALGDGSEAGYEAAAWAKAANGANDVWQCYVAGLDPTNAASVFLARIAVTNGSAAVAWTPDLNEGGTKTARVYAVEGKADLGDGSWGPTNESTRFYRVKVSLP